MTRRIRIDCPHERRPGMALCLHCLHADRVAAQERRRRFFIRATLGVLTLGLVAVVGAASLGGLQSRGAAAAPSKTAQRPVKAPLPLATVAAKTDSSVPTAPPAQQGMSDSIAAAAPATPQPASVAATAPESAKVVATTVSVPAAPPAPFPQPPQPIVPQGRTELRDSLFAVRTGDTVRVYFDTSPTRTRRPDKFERIVRQTLAAVYGPVADTVLSAIADGTLGTSADLVGELPTRGIHLPVPGGWKISLWPETRPGRNGPLVVAYRTLVGR